MSSHTSAGAPASCTAQAGMLPFSSALNPFPSCKQKAFHVLLCGTFSLLGCWPGRLPQAGMLLFSSALNPFPSCKQKAHEVLLCGTFSLLGYWPGRWPSALQQCLNLTSSCVQKPDGVLLIVKLLENWPRHLIGEWVRPSN